MEKKLTLLLIIIIAAYLRFYNLMFDAPYFFNPDERNMAYAITQFHLPQNLKDIIYGFQSKTSNLKPVICNLNPHFFAYGQFPLYLSFLSGYLNNIFTHNQLSLPLSQAILWLRFWSALASTLTVLLVFLIAKSVFDQNKSYWWVLIPALLTAFTPGLIQAAHFGTTESLLTFFFLTLIYLSILYSSKKILNSYFLILTSLVLGLALSTKISAFIFLPIPLLAIFLTKTRLYKKILFSFLILTSSFLILVFASPFNLLDWKSFLASMNYETGVATGSIRVFYTRQFERTIPIIFQAQKIFPYTLGWPIFLIGVGGFLLMIINLIINITQTVKSKYQNLNIKNQNDKEKSKIFNFKLPFFILIFSFLIYFLPNAFLYTKWTRFMTPILPLFAIFTVYPLTQINNLFNKFIRRIKNSELRIKKDNVKFRINWKFNYLIIGLLIFISLIPGVAFFSIYFKPDVRVIASEWIYQNIPDNSYILSETANVVDIPIHKNNGTMEQWNSRIISFNFYEVDENPTRFEELINHLEKADYIFIPSRRIFANHLRLPEKYPLTSRYYELLFSGRLGFEKVAEFTSFPNFQFSIFNFQLNDENAEETFAVFDHPVVRIYQKKTHYNYEKYKNLFKSTNKTLWKQEKPD